MREWIERELGLPAEHVVVIVRGPWQSTKTYHHPVVGPLPLGRGPPCPPRRQASVPAWQAMCVATPRVAPVMHMSDSPPSSNQSKRDSDA
ncbi:hypothetical protein GCM10010317_069270 [Streptomyces mirabilis]|nr:hypothetical protein GCM10010317_069270 [Streptomyces mirabilis]